MPNLTNSQGEPTGAVYGVVNMLRRLLKEQPAEYFAVVFDASGPTFRSQMYPEYKANRPPMPDELRVQIQPLHDVISALGLPLICVKGVEADDVIGTLTVAASEIGIETLIASGDKDLAQLVGDKVLLMDSMKDVTYNAAGVVNKFGVPPERMIDFLTLVGDTVDNIPGVPKVGPKTASKWLNEFGSLDELVQHADDIGGKVGENLRAALDQLPMSKALATIKLDVQLDVHPDGLQLQPADKSRLRTLFAGLEFKTWLSELGGLSGGDDKAKSPSVDYQVIFDQKALNRWIKRLQSAKLISVDTETTSLDPMQARIVGLSFTDRPCEAAYLPLGHDYAGAPDQLSLEDALAQLKPLLEDPALPKVGQNLKYDRSVLLNHDIELQGIRFDTMLESYVLDSTGSRHDMDTLSLKYLGLNPIRFEDVAGKGKKQLTFNQVPVETAAPYAAEDADLVLRLHQTLYPRLKQFEKQHELLENIEMPLLPVLSRIERTGVRVDSDMLALQSSELSERSNFEAPQDVLTVVTEPAITDDDSDGGDVEAKGEDTITAAGSFVFCGLAGCCGWRRGRRGGGRLGGALLCAGRRRFGRVGELFDVRLGRPRREWRLPAAHLRREGRRELRAVLAGRRVASLVRTRLGHCRGGAGLSGVQGAPRAAPVARLPRRGDGRLLGPLPVETHSIRM